MGEIVVRERVVVLRRLNIVSADFESGYDVVSALVRSKMTY